MEGKLEDEHSKLEIENRWFKCLNDRLLLERTMANKKSFGKKALNPEVVISTWSEVISRECNCSENWLQCKRVLVGRVH